MSSEERTYLHNYEQKKKKALSGEFGKTPQYWMQYVELVDRQYQFHFAIKTNRYDLRLQIWDQFLPLCFVTNRLHYARYGTYYINQMKKPAHHSPWG